VYGSGSELRSIPNLSDLGSALESFGSIKFIDAATLSPVEQVQEFMHTDILIAQHGAGLSNILWMPCGATVIEIQPPLAPTIDHIFSNLAAALKLKYTVLYQEHEHSSVDVNAVSHCVRGVLAGEIGAVPVPSTRFPIRWARNLFRQW
jgi:capsular polysaccharide biosynthesis protein